MTKKNRTQLNKGFKEIVKQRSSSSLGSPTNMNCQTPKSPEEKEQNDDTKRKWQEKVERARQRRASQIVTQHEYDWLDPQSNPNTGLQR